jgi:hypothetical protein
LKSDLSLLLETRKTGEKGKKVRTMENTIKGDTAIFFLKLISPLILVGNYWKKWKMIKREKKDNGMILAKCWQEYKKNENSFCVLLLLASPFVNTIAHQSGNIKKKTRKSIGNRMNFN